MLITTTSDKSKCGNLIKSLEKFGYDYHIIEHNWYGFLSKLHETYKYLKTSNHTHFLYTDAWDTVALGPELKIPDGLLFSAERACYPHPEKASLYPEVSSPWKYVNGGGFCGEVAAFIKLYELHKPESELNDQVWLTDMYLKGYDWIKLDTNCEIFQTVAFCPESDFEVEEGRIKNTVTGTKPLFFHGNGHTPINWIYDLL